MTTRHAQDDGAPEDRAREVWDDTRPEGPWTFDGPVAEAFPNMLSRSIPDYGGCATS